MYPKKTLLCATVAAVSYVGIAAGSTHATDPAAGSGRLTVDAGRGRDGAPVADLPLVSVSPFTSYRDGASGVATGGGFVWTARNDGTPTIGKRSAVTGELLASYELFGFHTQDLIYSEGFVWAAMHEGVVLRVDATTGEIAPIVDVDAKASGIVEAGGQIWVVGTGFVSRIDPQSAEEIERFEFPGHVFGDVDVVGDRLWIAAQDSVVEFDTTSGEIVSSVGLAGATAVERVGNHVWVSDTVGDQVVKIDTQSAEVVAAVHVDQVYVGMAFDGERLWVSADGGKLRAIDPASADVVGSMSVLNADFTYLAFDGSELWGVDPIAGLLYEFDV